MKIFPSHLFSSANQVSPEGTIATLDLEAPKNGETNQTKVVPLKSDQFLGKDPYFNGDQIEHFSKLKIDHFLSKKFIAHLFCDSFLENSPHTGWFFQDSIMHMIQVLEENTVTREIADVKEQLKDCFSFHSQYMAPLKDYTSDDGKVELEVAAVKEKLGERIGGLAVGQRNLFSGGYLGHQALYEVVRAGEDNYEFKVYNTGSGVQKHWGFLQKEGDHKISATYTLTNIRLEKLLQTDFLDQLIQLTRRDSQDFPVELYDTILPILEGERKAAPLDTDEYMASQRSGTCVWKVLCAYVRSNVPLHQYKYLKLKARLGVFEKWKELGYKIDFNKLLQRVLNRSVVNYEFMYHEADSLAIEFSREELLAMGLLKVQKTFNRYKFLLKPEEITSAEDCYQSLTGYSIYEDNGFLIRKKFGKNEVH